MGQSIVLLFVIVIFCFVKVNKVTSVVCNISMKHDFGKPQPIFIKDGELLAPNERGEISVTSNNSLVVICPGNRRLIVLGNDTLDISVTGFRPSLRMFKEGWAMTLQLHLDSVGIGGCYRDCSTEEVESVTANMHTILVEFYEVQCVGDGEFRIGEWEGKFKDIRCNFPPWVTAELVDDTCYDGGDIYRVGYRMSNDFVTVYEVCFDNNFLSTVYTKHTVSPGSSYVQSGGRPQFFAGEIFGSVRISESYKLKNQKKVLNSILGKDQDQYYLTKKQFLTRGHLAPRADFSLRSVQRASFHYINAAPQWLRGNAGDWAALEEAIRRRVKQYGKPVTVYTGTYGLMTLAGELSEQKPIWLAVDNNRNNVVPVPLYFYKIVYDPDTKSAVAFVSINSSYYNVSLIEDMKFCEDICLGTMKFRWLKWRDNDGTFSFCCDYNEFSETIGHHDLDVNNLFF